MAVSPAEASPLLLIGQGNIKLGRILTFTLPSKFTCPGASAWCLNHCYALRIERLRPNCRNAYAANMAATFDAAAFEASMLRRIPEDADALRIHVGGDFYSRPYIAAWVRICQARPHVRFWAYTRSWNVPKLLPALETLRALPNVELFASTDPSMPLPPEGWRIAFLASDARAHGMACKEQEKREDSCHSCRYCFAVKKGNVIFAEH